MAMAAAPKPWAIGRDYKDPSGVHRSARLPLGGGRQGFWLPGEALIPVPSAQGGRENLGKKAGRTPGC
jgi:hypothetical protein